MGRQQDVGHGDRQRRENRVGVHDEVDRLQCVVVTRSVHAGARKAVGGLEPDHLDRIRIAIRQLAGLDAVQDAVGSCMGDELAVEVEGEGVTSAP